MTMIDRLQLTGGSCHGMGLVSPGGVHSHQVHAAVLAGILAAASVPTLLHAFTDGRDTPPRSAGEGIVSLLPPPARSAPIAPVRRRHYHMDRDKRCGRVPENYHATLLAQRAPSAGPLRGGCG